MAKCVSSADYARIDENSQSLIGGLWLVMNEAHII